MSDTRDDRGDSAESTTAAPSIKEIEAAYENGTNVMGLLRQRGRVNHNTPDSILISYDLQSGSYSALMEDAEHRRIKDYINEGMAVVLRPLLGADLLEVGVGEASSLGGVIQKLGIQTSSVGGFDISWSRAAFARQHLGRLGLPGVTLFTGDIGAIPLVDDAYDVVYTAHSLEPNGGRERECLQELFRITRKWLVLFEPAFELGNAETKDRVREHGYCRGLPDIARELGYDVVEFRLFERSVFSFNQTQQIVIRKRTNDEAPPRVDPGFETTR